MKINKKTKTLVLFILISNLAWAQSNFRDFQGTWHGVNNYGDTYVLQINFDYSASLTVDGKSIYVTAVKVNTTQSPAEIDFVVTDPDSPDQATMSGIAEVGATDNGTLKMLLEYDEGMNRPAAFNAPIAFIRQ